MTTTVAIFSDTHINSTVGLCPPVVNLDDGGTFRSSPLQRDLWRFWLDYWEQIGKLPGKKVCIINGDLGELDTKRRTNQIITPNKATIQRIVLDTLAPAFDTCGAFVFIRGTQAHIGKSAWLEEAIAQDVDATVRCHKDAPASWYHWRGVVDGVRFDVAHHAAMGRLPHTEKNAGNKIASTILYRYCVDMKEKPPHVAVRSHNHRYADSGGNYETFAVCTPAFTAATEYVYRIGQENSVADIGGLAFVCDKGKYDLKDYRYKPRKGKLWKAI